VCKNGTNLSLSVDLADVKAVSYLVATFTS